ncbi:MAG: ATP-binding protein [Prevotella sp.]|jgi:AAA+ ATPase superfamily predicted ATPase|nr:ATP-binding protein [Prevotella sp.]
MDNPFVTKGYAGPEYFCDRVEETKRLVELTTNGNNIALISPRRVGKTDLIHHCFQQPELKEKYYTFHIDIYATASLRDFVNVFGQTILNELKPKGRVVWEGFLNILRSIRSEITYDINNFPTWSIGLGNIENPMVTLDEIFQYLGQADRPCIIAIDEFQQITRYAEAHNIEAMLRTYIQRCNNATFIFSGSKRHLMGEIFTSPSRPFYQSVLVMNLKPISVEKYTEFAKMQFDRYGKSIEDEAVVAVYERFDAVTSCLQRILNVLFLKTLPGGKCTCDMVDDAINYILDMFSETYQDLLERIPEKQREVFIAIAKEGKAKAITGKTFIKKHHLQTSSVINAAVRGLLEKDFITVDKGVYTIYDPFFALWLRNGR